MYFLAFILGASIGFGVLYQKSSARGYLKTLVFLFNIISIVSYASYYNISEWKDLILSLISVFSAYFFVVKIFGK